MGYTTQFEGSFNIDKEVDKETYKLLKGIADTRRIKRAGLDKKYGVEGEFYFKDEKTGVVNYNEPPRTQPSLYCQWIIQEDRKTIIWDDGEKFYNYVEWIEYLINSILQPRGYTVNGLVIWQGEDMMDRGLISVKNNIVITKDLQ